METDEDTSGIETVPCPHCGFETRLIPVRTANELPNQPQPVEQQIPASKISEPVISPKEMEEKPVYEMQGCGLSSLEVYTDRVVILAGGIISSGSSKTIPFLSITAVQLKTAGIGRGSLQFTIPGGSEGRVGTMISSDGEFFVGATASSNSFAYSNGLFMSESNDDLARKIKIYIEKRIRELRETSKSSPTASLSDELAKLANLKTQGVLSEDEFQVAKKRLLAG